MHTKFEMQALFSAKQERPSGIYPASGITPTYLINLGGGHSLHAWLLVDFGGGWGLDMEIEELKKVVELGLCRVSSLPAHNLYTI